MRRYFAALFLLPCVLLGGPMDRVRYNFNAGWKLAMSDPAEAAKPAYDDSGWKAVVLPRAFNEDEAFRVSIHDLTTGIVWYRKHFKLPSDAAGRKIFLEFEGIRQGGEFYLNGQFIGRHENGVMAFGFDITSAVRPAPEENLLAVRIDNSWDYAEKSTGTQFQWNDRNFNANYGGINKGVYLHVTGKLYQTLPLYSTLGTTGVYVHAGDFSIPGHSARITVESQIKNENDGPRTFRYAVTITDLDGKLVDTIDGGTHTIAPGEVSTISASKVVANLHFWSWGYGYLYNVRTALLVEGQEVDAVNTRTGFRKTEFGNGMVKLNDRVIHLKGYGQRTTNEWPAVGSSVPAWMSDLSNRMIVEGNGNLIRWMHITPWKQDIESCDRVGLLESMPAGDSEGDATGRQWEQRVELMRDAIVYNRNHPSILFYESGNKGISEDHMRDMKKVRDQFDPQGGRAIGAREMLDSTEAEYGGEMLYVNKSRGKPLWMMEYSRDEALRAYWDEFSPPFHKDKPPYNRNLDSFAVEDVVRWFDYWQERPGTGDRVNAGGVNIIFSDSNTHFRGEENYRRSGEVDALRIPKDGYFAHQVMWDGWVDVEHPRTRIIGHWNYRPGVRKDVFVVSSAERVELFVNGQSQGFGRQSSRFLFTFPDIAWRPGTLLAVGDDAHGKRISSDQLQTAGAPAKVRLKLQTGPKGMLADGSDLALIDVEVVDASGLRCPIANNMIRFALSGPAEWRGGLASGPGNFILAKDLPVERGVNRVIVRSTPAAGKIILTAQSEGLAAASLEWTSQPVRSDGSLSPEVRDEGPRPYLARGPTPSGSSFTPSRVPLRILAVTAGANTEQASRSFDDDETTRWESDGVQEHAWIEYTLAGSAVPSQVVLKLPGWRNRTYPLRITVDGVEVYSGSTTLNYGYVTLPLSPHPGRKLRIELSGSVKGRNGAEIVGLGNERDAAASGLGITSAYVLSIVEVEIYAGTPHR